MGVEQTLPKVRLVALLTLEGSSPLTLVLPLKQNQTNLTFQKLAYTD